jgi:hypothetical protein
MNGFDKEHDPSLLRGSVYEKDQSAYYPNPPKGDQYSTPTVPKTSEAAKSRYSSSIYQLDQKPYYGQNMDYRVIQNSISKDQMSVPIQMGDLTSHHADSKNLQKLQNQLESLDKKPELGEVAINGKYQGDPTPYYDPTLKEKAALKEHLTNSIERMQENLSQKDMPDFKFEKINTTPRVQNFINQNKEETNEFIAKSYHYGVSKDNKTGFNIPGPVGENSKVDLDSMSKNLNSYNVNSTNHDTVAGLSNSTDNKTNGIASDINENNNNTFSNRNNGKKEKVEKSNTPSDRKIGGRDDIMHRNESISISNDTINEKTTSVKKTIIVEADTKTSNYVEAEDAGSVLGKNYYAYNETVKPFNKSVIYEDNKPIIEKNNGTMTQLEKPVFKNTNMYVRSEQKIENANKMKNLK